MRGEREREEGKKGDEERGKDGDGGRKEREEHGKAVYTCSSILKSKGGYVGLGVCSVSVWVVGGGLTSDKVLYSCNERLPIPGGH